VPGVKETPRSTSPNPAALTVRNRSQGAAAVAFSGSVISTSLFGSAPWSPPPLTVEVIAQIDRQKRGDTGSCAHGPSRKSFGPLRTSNRRDGTRRLTVGE
jgi:hypothetical protein